MRAGFLDLMNSSFDNVVNGFSCFADVPKRQPEYGVQQQ